MIEKSLGSFQEGLSGQPVRFEDKREHTFHQKRCFPLPFFNARGTKHGVRKPLRMQSLGTSGVEREELRKKADSCQELGCIHDLSITPTPGAKGR